MRAQKIVIVLIGLLAFTIPICQPIVLPFLSGLIFICSLFRISSMRKMEWGLISMLGVLLFVLYVLSMLWSANLEVGMSNLETKLALFFLPIALALNGPYCKKTLDFFLLAFIGGLVVSECVHLGHAAVCSFYESDYSAFAYSRLAASFHPSYLTMYFNAGVVILLFRKDLRVFNFPDKWLKILVISSFIIMIALLTSKTGLLTISLILVIHIFRSFYKKKSDLGLISIGYLVVFSISVLLAPATVGRIQNAVIPTQEKANQTLNTEVPEIQVKRSSEARLVAWETSVDILLKNPFGVGVGDAKQILLDSYAENGERYLLERKTNSHNQFLQTGISIGWPGIFVLLVMFSGLMLRAYNHSDWLLGMILIILLLNFGTESMLERASGASFYAFILSILVFQGSKT